MPLRLRGRPAVHACQIACLGHFPDSNKGTLVEIDGVDERVHVFISPGSARTRSDESLSIDRINPVNAPRTDLVAVLGKTPLLANLSQPELQNLAARTVRKLFSTGELIFSEGEPCNGLHIIARGKVRIFKTSVNGREQVLALNGPGESVAELPVFDGGPFPASAVAIDDTEMAFISRRDFQAYCMEHPEVSLKVLSVVGQRLRQLVGIIEELSFTTIRQRLISVLVKLAQSEGKKTPGGVEFLLPSTHQELANQLGTVRELISRNLMRLQAEGLLDVDARHIVVKDLRALAALLETA